MRTFEINVDDFKSQMKGESMIKDVTAYGKSLRIESATPSLALGIFEFHQSYFQTN